MKDSEKQKWCHDEVIYYADKRLQQSAILKVFHYFYLRTVYIEVIMIENLICE